MTEDRLAELMVKVVDHVATPAEREELMAHVTQHTELARELEQHQALKAVSDGWVARLEHDLLMDAHQSRSSVRIERTLGLTLLLVGLCSLGGFGLVELLFEPDAPLWVKIGVTASVAGVLTLLGSLIRQRLTTSDPYSEVIR